MSNEWYRRCGWPEGFGFDSRRLPAARSSHHLAVPTSSMLSEHRSGVRIPTRAKLLSRLGGQRDSNPRSLLPQSSALPLSYGHHADYFTIMSLLRQKKLILAVLINLYLYQSGRREFSVSQEHGHSLFPNIQYQLLCFHHRKLRRQ